MPGPFRFNYGWLWPQVSSPWALLRIGRTGTIGAALAGRKATSLSQLLKAKCSWPGPDSGLGSFQDNGRRDEHLDATLDGQP